MIPAELKPGSMVQHRRHGGIARVPSGGPKFKIDPNGLNGEVYIYLEAVSTYYDEVIWAVCNLDPI